MLKEKFFKKFTMTEDLTDPLEDDDRIHWIEGCEPDDIWNFFSTEISSLLDKIEVMIAEEMNIAASEGQPTSRLTSLAVKLDKARKELG